MGYYTLKPVDEYSWLSTFYKQRKPDMIIQRADHASVIVSHFFERLLLVHVIWIFFWRFLTMRCLLPMIFYFVYPIWILFLRFQLWSHIVHNHIVRLLSLSPTCVSAWSCHGVLQQQWSTVDCTCTWMCYGWLWAICTGTFDYSFLSHQLLW